MPVAWRSLNGFSKWNEIELDDLLSPLEIPFNLKYDHLLIEKRPGPCHREAHNGNLVGRFLLDYNSTTVL